MVRRSAQPAPPMASVGSNVYSLPGFPIAKIPDFIDHGGVKTTFTAHLRDPKLGTIEVAGTRTVLGLVLHRRITWPGEPPRDHRWTISEPTRGGAIARGKARQDALDDLALKIAYYGGIEAFQQLLDDAIAQVGRQRQRRQGKRA